MCETKTILIVAVLLLAAAGFYTCQVKPKVEQHREIESESPCEKEYKNYCMTEANAFI